MDGMDALDAAGVRLVELVGQVGPEQWAIPRRAPSGLSAPWLAT